MRQSISKMNFYVQAERDRNLLAGPNPNWMLNQKTGLTIKTVTLDDFGGYNCSAKVGNKTHSKNFRVILSGISSEKEI